jgi:hypothetical protein
VIPYKLSKGKSSATIDSIQFCGGGVGFSKRKMTSYMLAPTAPRKTAPSVLSRVGACEDWRPEDDIFRGKQTKQRMEAERGGRDTQGLARRRRYSINKGRNFSTPSVARVLLEAQSPGWNLPCDDNHTGKGMGCCYIESVLRIRIIRSSTLWG